MAMVRTAVPTLNVAVDATDWSSGAASLRPSLSPGGLPSDLPSSLARAAVTSPALPRRFRLCRMGLTCWEACRCCWGPTALPWSTAGSVGERQVGRQVRP